MKFIRVVLAVEDDDLDAFRRALDVFIESEDAVQGAYQSTPFDQRRAALGAGFVSIAQADLLALTARRAGLRPGGGA